MNFNVFKRIGLTKLTTRIYFEFLLVSLGLLYLVFNTSLATIYTILIVADFVLYYFNFRPDQSIRFPLERRIDNRIPSLIITVIAYAAFLAISTVAVNSFFPLAIAESGMTGAFAVVALMSASVPIFAGSIALSLFAFGILVPMVESSLFFGRILERVVEVIENRTGKKVSQTQISVATVLAVAFCTALFIFYHVGSKGLANAPLFVTGIFAAISCALVIYHRELKQAVLLHIISNSIVILVMFKIIGGWKNVR